MSGPSRWPRRLLWDYDRGARAYELLCLLLLLVLLAVPGGWWCDPMRDLLR